MTTKRKNGHKTRSALVALLNSDQLRVAVLGLGRIGLPTAGVFARGGAHVTGVDIRKDVVDDTNAGKCRLEDEPGLPAIIKEAVAAGKLRATLQSSDAIK